ncbi:MAG: hypothetical protein K6A90_07190 [Lachnospiraceae bacterium]|nr:hypothetical protein [Lachnospiraceae bacterium]
MGMFDTFWGEYQCDFCGNIVYFEEQTKDYECVLADFLLGDYVDKGNKNYYYELESYCPECHHKHDVRLAIRRGQFVGIYKDYEAEGHPVESLDNIEDGYMRKVLEKRRYDHKMGRLDITGRSGFGRRKHVGDVIRVFDVEWIVDEVYKTIEKSRVFKDTALIYRTHADDFKRIIVVSRNGFLKTRDVCLYLDDFGTDFPEELRKRPKRYGDYDRREAGYVAYKEIFACYDEIALIEKR